MYVHIFINYKYIFIFEEMVWNILNNVDLETAKNEPLDKRVPFLELSGIIEVKISFNNNKH